MKKLSILFLFLLALGWSSCKKYLDIVPDNVATINNAFAMRNTAERYLFTCYSYLPAEGDPFANPGFTAGDEIWLHDPFTEKVAYGREIARGNQSIVEPYLNYWDGLNGGKPLFKGIRDCNTFLDNIARVPDMEASEKDRWIAEVKFLKAYYNFYLLRMYGPIPLIKVNLPITAGPEEVRVERMPVDSCFDYIVQLLNEASPNLPKAITNETAELGRITMPIALAIKARVLVYAASPLFNGNAEYANFTNNDGTKLFNATFDATKWEKAKVACKEAIDTCLSVGRKLYYYNQSVTQYNVSPETKIQMNIRNALTEKWNAEVIWGLNSSVATEIQTQSTPRGLDPATISNGIPQGNFAPPLKIVEMFYTKNGVPITEDVTWNYANRLQLRMATVTQKNLLRPDSITASLNFDREPRFYADLGFDGGVWYGQGRYDETNSFFIANKSGQAQAKIQPIAYSVTGYLPKKLVNYLSVMDATTYSIKAYQWPAFRLADLYLLYAEALNETSVTPTAEAYDYVNKIRERAGLPTVQTSWSQFSTDPVKYTNKEGFREIIQQERMIELAFEGQRFWDLRRWKKAITVMNNPIKGFDIDQDKAASYYQEKILYNQTFKTRDYFWPIKESNTIVNRKLVQNPGW